MSQILVLRGGQSVYVTNKQAEDIYEALNSNPNLRILKVITGQGYIYLNPFSIVTMTPSLGEAYRSDADVLKDQQSALRSMGAARLGERSAGMIGLPEEGGQTS